MRIAICLYKYFPYGGIPRDSMKIAREAVRRGHEVVFYVLRWLDEQPRDMEVVNYFLPDAPAPQQRRHPPDEAQNREQPRSERGDVPRAHWRSCTEPHRSRFEQPRRTRIVRAGQPTLLRARSRQRELAKQPRAHW